MSYPVYEAKTVDKAIVRAAADLNIDQDALEYDVISHGSTGIFGLVGVKKAKIRVFVPEGSLPAHASDSSSGVKSLVDEAFNTGAPAKPKPQRNKPKQNQPRGGSKPKQGRPQPAKKDTPKPALKQEDRRPASQRPAPEPVSTEPVEVPEEALEKGLGVLRKVVGMISDSGEIKIDKQPDRLLLSIEGGDSGMLIGKRGQTLEAIQYLVDKVINKHTDHRVRVQIDVEGYLETRRESLESLAAKLAERTKRTGKPSTIGQMTAHDRRIVHLALKDDKAVRTQSMGDGYYRKLVIFPKKSGQKRRRNNTPKRNV